MSTGGGAPCYHDGMDVINANGVSIFIDVEVDTLLERTKQKSHRPLLNSGTDEELKSKLSDLLAQREKIYRKASFTLVKPTLTDVLAVLQFKK
jgi:shikimate kinase